MFFKSYKINLKKNKFKIKNNFVKKQLSIFFFKKKTLKKHKDRLYRNLFLSYIFKNKKIKYEQTLLKSYYKKNTIFFIQPFLFNKLIVSKIFKYKLLKRLGNL
jgi:hypothetical protein